MKKKLLSLALVVAMIAIIAAGSLAYFTDTDSAKNVMTMGSVDIDQKEYQRDGNGGIETFAQNKTLIPMGVDTAWAEETVTVNGDSFKVFDSENVLDKIVTVENTGNTPAYVRTIVALEAGNSATEAEKLWYNNIGVTDNTGVGETAVVSEDNDLFVKIGDNYYIIIVYTYTSAIEAGTESEASLTGVALYKNTTQEDVKNFGESYEVLVLSQAVQASDMGDDAGAALDAAFGDVNATNVAAWFADIA